VAKICFSKRKKDREGQIIRVLVLSSPPKNNQKITLMETLVNSNKQNIA
jgi:hypothetical protein